MKIKQTISKLLIKLLPAFIIFSILTTMNLIFNVHNFSEKESYIIFLLVYVVTYFYDVDVNVVEK